MSERACLRIPHHQLECASFWPLLNPRAPLPVVAVNARTVTVISTNRYCASWVTWPADEDLVASRAVPLVHLRRVRTVRGLLSLSRHSRADAGFDYRHIMSLAELPSRAEAVMTRAEIERVVAHLDDWLWGDGYGSVDALDGRLYIARRSFAADVLYWHEQEPLDLNLSFIREVFVRVFSPTITLSIKREGKLRMLHVSGESGGVRENHILVGLRWNI